MRYQVTVTATILAVGALLASCDVAPIDDGPLRLPEATDEESAAFVTLNRIALALEWTEPAADGSFQSPAWRGDRLQENEPLLDELAGVLDGSAFRFPALDAIDGPSWEAGRFGRLGDLLLFAASESLSEGDHARAAERVGQALALGHRVESGKGGLIGYLVGQAIEARSLLWTRDNAHAFTEGSFEPWAGHGLTTEALADAYRSEYASVTDAIERGWGEEEQAMSFYTYHPERTKREFFDSTMTALAELKRPCSERAFEPPTEMSWVDYLQPNSVGRILHGIASSSANTGYSDCRGAVAHAATGAVVALIYYEKRHGRLPETLQGLVPEFIASVPDDPFAPGHSLRYSSTARTVYSVGENLIDDAGSFTGSPLTALDVGFEIPTW